MTLLDGMAVLDEVVVEQPVPEPVLRAWIGDRLPGEGPFRIRRVGSGPADETFAIARSGRQWMLRRPARVADVPAAHGIAREHRVLQALADSDVPHARGLLLCEDPDVLGVPFSLVEMVRGTSFRAGIPSGPDSPFARRRIAEDMVDALAALHRLDWEAAGLADLGRPDRSTARQVGRWMARLDRDRTRDLPDLDAAARWLEDHAPKLQRPALVHGDYGLHNALFAPEPPLRLLAVVDWRTATIGDPLMDLGHLLGLWLEPGEPEVWTASALPYAVDGFPSRRELAERYAARTGLDVRTIDWYRALAQLVMACVLEGGHARHLAGATDDPTLATCRARVANHAAHALAITRGEA